MGRCLLLLLLLVCTVCRAQYLNSDLHLPRMRGVKKIVATTIRHSQNGKQAKTTTGKMVLYLDKDGRVARDENYQPAQGWPYSAYSYSYTGADTEASVVKVFSYPGEILSVRRPSNKVHMSQSAEYTDDHTNPLAQERCFYMLDDSGKKRLLHRSTSAYNEQGRLVTFVYHSFESGYYADSSSISYRGDTCISQEYRLRRGETLATKSDITVHHKDGQGRLAGSERIASSFTDFLRRDDMHYDRYGRLQGITWRQQCSTCKGGWLSGGERRRYDARSRLISVVYTTEGKTETECRLQYVE